jgi:hypothetical protein
MVRMAGQIQDTAMKAEARSRLLSGFKCPPDEFRPVPFWWWVGEPLRKERLLWQLDALRAKGIRNAVISYNHHADGTSNPGDPPVFSHAWWDLLRWMTRECASRGMKISFQDYTLLNPLLQAIGWKTPGMAGGRLREVSRELAGGQTCALDVEAGNIFIAAGAYPLDNGVANAGLGIDLSKAVSNGTLSWRAPEGTWRVSMVSCVPNRFDPMHPLSGQLAIEAFYRPFEANCPGELGKTIPILFQDELDFGARMPLWSSRFADEFLERKGYGIVPVLPALWHDFGPATAKIRIDYSDVVTTLIETSYFMPVFHWAQERGLLIANDNGGRGLIEQGREYYGDYFRTMRWFNAPGNDDPRIDRPRAFKGLKVNSSIAHLYQRQRVWNECFHSSGWGATPAQMVAALNEDFAYGATVVNLHGLYYTTFGSWWEWAPPDFHFRQPYWRCMDTFNDYASRLCFMLSRGVHVCDAAIVYPVTAIEAGLNRRIPDPLEGAVPYSEGQAGKVQALVDEAEAHAFGIGRELCDAGIDFDFVDFQSLEKAEVRDGRLCVAGEEYRVLILPAMSAARFSTLEAARNFREAGGLVIAYGRLPCASDRAGSCDPELDSLVAGLFTPGGTHPGVFVRGGYGQVRQAIDAAVQRDFIPAQTGLCVVHRRVDGDDIYYVFNKGVEPYTGDTFFRASGEACLWDAWTGDRHALPDARAENGGTRLRLRLEPSEAKVIVFGAASREPAVGAAGDAAFGRQVLELDGDWQCDIEPTLDNRFGDFRLPARDGMIGPEVRRFRYAEETSSNPPWHRPEFDDSTWPLKTFSFGPRFLVLGPLPPDVDLSGLERDLLESGAPDASVPVVVGGTAYAWRPYDMSLRWGIENDPFMKDWASGPHGLKNRVPLEFLDLNCDKPGSIWYAWSAVAAGEDRLAPMIMGSRSRYSAWLNGEQVMAQEESLPPGRQSQWNLPHYRSSPREATIALNKGYNPLLLKFTQPDGQRVRAYVAFDPPPENGHIELRWFNSPRVLGFDCYPHRGAHAGWYRFMSPPGLKSVRAVIRGVPRVWIAGAEAVPEVAGRRDDGAVEYRIGVQNPAAGQVLVAIRVQSPAGSFAGDAFPEPVALECMTGRIRVGDWCRFGLESYSGIVRYRRRFRMDGAGIAGGAWFLDLGEVACAAEVVLNGRIVGSRVAPPWRLDVGGNLRKGENSLEIAVANTLGNHYGVGIPTPYVYEGQTVSGLIGPVRLVKGMNTK